jgi:cell division transport system permease protein
MFRQRADLQLAADPAGRFLPSVMAVMVFLGTLSFAGAIVLDGAMQSWSRSIEGTLTVQVGDMKSPDSRARVAVAVELLKATPGVADAVPLDKAAVDHLLEPWLGRESLAADLPIPALIDVRLVRDAEIDTAALGTRLAQAVPGARLDDHKPWLAHMVRFARTLQWLAIGIVALVGLATVALVVFATRAGLAVHSEVIEVLHLIGARDGYIAGQFQRHTLRLAAGGAIVGLLLVGAVLLLLAGIAANLEAPLLPKLQFEARHWAMLAGIALAAVALATVTARITVMRTLKRMI